MLERLFSKTITNEYHGLALAKWVFAAMMVLTSGRSLAHIVLADGGAQSIATIPLYDFSSEASAVIIGLFAQ